MPYRRIKFLNENYYHIFNHGRNKDIFSWDQDCQRVLTVLKYYRFQKTPLSFSALIKLQPELQNKIINNLTKEGNRQVEIVAFCLMPNHYHLLLKQLKLNGIKNFISNFQNSYAKYFNLKRQNNGPVFKDRFQAVALTSDDQLLHLSRYIHLNPYSSGINKRKEDLLNYDLSSFAQYVKGTPGFCQPKIILDQFKNRQAYKEFVFNQADYQKELQKIKLLTLETQPRGWVW